MTVIKASDYGMQPGKEIGKQLSELFSKLQGVQGEKTLVFEKGEYYIDSDNCDYVYYAITNTVGEKEIKNKDELNMHRVAFNIVDAENLIIDGGGSLFIIDGKVTNMALSNCKNVTVKNLKIDTVNPNVHKLTVKKHSLFSATFELSKQSKYRTENGNYIWYGKGYELGFMEKKNSAFWTAGIKPSKPHKIFRTAHPFALSSGIKELSPYNFKVKYTAPKLFKTGQTYYVFNACRSDVGIFVSQSENIVLDNVAQYFNYSLAYVAQDCVNLTLKNLRFAPKENSGMEMASLADFVQICMCAGDVYITDCVFDGAADDALNVHGVHFKISNVSGKKIVVDFCHEQTWGFNPLHAGDAIEFIEPSTLLCVGSNKIVSSKLIDKYKIQLELENDNIPAGKNLVIEDIDRCPNVLFENNFADRIITRGLLLTTRGKVVVRGNHFVSTTMSGILHSDDAKNWYESGMVKDVLIENNRFDYCGGAPILILPENTNHAGAVHNNIKIISNIFKAFKGPCIRAKSAKGIEIRGNDFSGKNPLQAENCENISKDF